MKKYALFPGYITSIHDREHHYIDAMALARLYRVPMSECVIINDRERHSAHSSELIPLHPRSDGRYEVKP